MITQKNKKNKTFLNIEKKKYDSLSNIIQSYLHIKNKQRDPVYQTSIQQEPAVENLRLFGASPTLSYLGNKKEIQPINYEYADDDEIQSLNPSYLDKLKKIDFDKNVILEIKSLYKMGQLRNDEDQYLPGLVSVKIKDQEDIFHLDQIRPGIDLICLIDVSASMRGFKLDLVKSTLNLFIQFLTQKDRFQLIIFNDQAKRLTQLKKLTENNKEYFKEQIQQIIANGGTSISAATQIAFQQLENRKYKNDLASIFLLSDGQDNSRNAEQIILKQLENLKEVFTFHTYGIGNDHDSKLMTALSNLKYGNFYFLSNIQLLDQYFAHAFGELISVVGCNLSLKILCNPNAPYDKILIEKTYGNMWQVMKKNREYLIKLPQISSGQNKEFLFELRLPNLDFKILEHQREVQIIQVELVLQNSLTKEVLTKHSELKLSFYNQEEVLPINQEDLTVAAQFQRIQTSQTIQQVSKACEEGKYDVAQKIIVDQIIEFEQKKEVSKIAPENIEHLKQARCAATIKNYSQYGQIQMRQIQYNNNSGCISQFNPQGRQNAFVDLSKSNLAQSELFNEVNKARSVKDIEKKQPTFLQQGFKLAQSYPNAKK